MTETFQILVTLFAAHVAMTRAPSAASRRIAATAVRPRRDALVEGAREAAGLLPWGVLGMLVVAFLPVDVALHRLIVAACALHLLGVGIRLALRAARSEIAVTAPSHAMLAGLVVALFVVTGVDTLDLAARLLAVVVPTLGAFAWFALLVGVAGVPPVGGGLHRHRRLPRRRTPLHGALHRLAAPAPFVAR